MCFVYFVIHRVRSFQKIEYTKNGEEKAKTKDKGNSLLVCHRNEMDDWALYTNMVLVSICHSKIPFWFRLQFAG